MEQRGIDAVMPSMCSSARIGRPAATRPMKPKPICSVCLRLSWMPRDAPDELDDALAIERAGTLSRVAERAVPGRFCCE